MQSEGFHYYFFDPIEFDAFVSYFQPRGEFESLAKARERFDDWQRGYYRKAIAFYSSQYERHKKIVRDEFCRLHQEPGTLGELDLDDEWNVYRQEHGLTDHRRQMIEAIERYKFALSTFSNLQTEYERIIQANRPSGKAKEFRQPSTKSINQLWFDVTIRSNTDDIAKLRALPYDQYLSTEHWCRLRAAVFLIHRAVCQEKGHFEMGESWYFEGWETEIDVHHLNFENRGNERYSDIALLCHEHHEMWCNNIRLYRQPKLEIADEEEY